jgi:phenylpyruvate tautomerase PptA (4-oxalocrotonate tautomerase family)
MPFVSVRILKGQSQAQKDEISRHISETIHEHATLLPGAQVWVVWEEVADEDWFVDDKSVKAIRSGKT